jgi:transposase
MEVTLTIQQKRSESTMKITTIGLDIAKSVFHFFAVNQMGRYVKKKQLKRAQLLSYFARLEPCLVAMEACGGANHWARALKELGHEVKLIAPQYVKPFVKGNKNDYNDAEAIAEAAQRPNMRFVPIKSVEQQDIQNLHRQRERIKKARTALVNQTRGLLAEYGVVINKGVTAVRTRLPEVLEDADNGLTVRSREVFAQLLEELREFDGRYKDCEKQIALSNQGREVCERLDGILGVGPLIASAVYAAAGDGKDFVNGRHFSAWVGLVPAQHSSGGKATLLGISKRGNTYLRTLFIHGARSVLRASKDKDDRFSLWAQRNMSMKIGHMGSKFSDYMAGSLMASRV